MIKDVMERDMINEISTLFVMIFTSGLMLVMPISDIWYNDIIVIIGFGIILSFMLTIIPVFYYLKYIDLRFLILILGLYLNSSTHINYPVILHVI